MGELDYYTNKSLVFLISLILLNSFFDFSIRYVLLPQVYLKHSSKSESINKSKQCLQNFAKL